MKPTTAFLVYLAVHHVMLFVAGTISIVLGYRLLMARLSAGRTADGKEPDQALPAQVGAAKFPLRNLVPGAAFAFFGAALLVGTAFQKPPEITLDKRDERTRTESRGDEPGGRPGHVTARAMQLLTQGDAPGALTLAIQASRAVASDLNDIAWVFLKANGDKQVAVRFADAAVSADGGKANYLDTWAAALVATGKRAVAIQALERASEIDPKYRGELERLKAVRAK